LPLALGFALFNGSAASLSPDGLLRHVPTQREAAAWAKLTTNAGAVPALLSPRPARALAKIAHRPARPNGLAAPGLALAVVGCWPAGAGGWAWMLGGLAVGGGLVPLLASEVA